MAFNGWTTTCPESGDQKHCGCQDSRETQVCCYCGKRITLMSDTPDPRYEDDGSLENIDA